MKKNLLITGLLACFIFAGACSASGQTCEAFHPGLLWTDNNGVHINAHGGGILFHEGNYYWFGEHKGERSNNALVGITCYSSPDLYNWKYESVALAVENDTASDITAGSIMERPKVIYNPTTRKFVMYFHLELKGRGYTAARVGIAVSNQITGPYKYLKSLRPNAGRFPENMTEAQKKATAKPSDFKNWWTPEWRKAVDDGMFVRRDLESGQMSRDMTLFVDDDGKACHIYSSEENLTLQLAELTDDYLNYTGKYIRIAPAGHNEAPAIFKKDGKYFMITSGCTGWEPNAARLFTADSLFGIWTQHSNPCVGQDANLTFHSQGTFILPVAGKKDAFIFMADRWRPKNPIDGRYIWLPILFENGLPMLKWQDKWDLSVFDNTTISLIRKVNDRWQSTHPKHGNAFWHTAAYHTGNMAAYEATGDERYHIYSEAWAEKNKWKGAKSNDKSKWKYNYGETDEYVLFGDWQTCFQTYIDLYNLKPDKKKIARAREVMEYEMSTPGNDYWWWADGLYMVMPVMTKLYRVTGNERYLQKQYEYFSYAKNLMYDSENGLFYRDAKYIFPKHKTKNGKKDFWSRGNGWVFAALAKVLQDLPADDSHRQEYIRIFQSMAKTLKTAQQPEGYWTRSILDEQQAPGYETSGTAFFAYGFLWGMNNGLLNKDEYAKTAQKAWEYLTKTALQPDGSVGYVQPIGERADQHKNVDKRTTTDFGVGAFLLAASEMLKFSTH
jgi:rhamnogalacturonyl hydrolase YesR